MLSTGAWIWSVGGCPGWLAFGFGSVIHRDSETAVSSLVVKPLNQVAAVSKCPFWVLL
jgi:hypothetical protein